MRLLINIMGRNMMICNIYFKITTPLKQPLENSIELEYCYRHGVLQLKDKKIKAAEVLIELIESRTKMPSA